MVLKLLPSCCKKKLASAQTAVHHEFKDGSSIVRQKLLIFPFFIELIQIISSTPFQLQYEVEQKRIFLFFMLDGTICFTTQESIKITKARKNYFYVSINHTGTYGINSFKGDSLALVISIEESWVLENIKEYNFLNISLSEILKHNDQFSLMPHCKIDEDVNNWLEQLLIMKSGKQKILRKVLEGFISKGLEYYEDWLTQKKTPDIHSVKEYLDKNFCNTDLSVDKLVELFPFSERTLYNHFMEMFETTAVQYYTMLRMELAKNMIDGQGIPLSEVWAQVGYRDQNTFRQAYNNYYPSDEKDV
ncbi:MAG: helix-turn-helix domain-containing protein [Sphingobacterium sp.]